MNAAKEKLEIVNGAAKTVRTIFRIQHKSAFQKVIHLTYNHYISYTIITMIYTATVTQKGQVTIPIEIRKYLGIKRITFLLDKDHKIIKVFDQVKPLTHAQELIQFIESIQN